MPVADAARALLRRPGAPAARLPFIRRRHAIASRYIAGTGIEIGGLNAPLRVPRGAHVRYVDRVPVSELREHYPELRSQPLVDVDILDDGERLATLSDGSEDFVIANHFLEHCEDPIRALVNMFRVLRPGGVLYLAVPDKRFIFDRDRPVTSLDHLLEHFEGAGVDRRAHFEEWVRLVDGVTGEAEVARRVDELMAQDYSIHFHVWTQAEVLELLLFLRRRLELDFEIELAVRNEHENIFVLRKES